MVGGHEAYIRSACHLTQGQRVGRHADGGHHLLLLFLGHGISLQSDMAQTGIVQQIDGVERVAPGVDCLAADVGIFQSFELLESSRLGALVCFAAIRGNLLLVPLGTNIALVFQWHPMHHILEGTDYPYD